MHALGRHLGRRLVGAIPLVVAAVVLNFAIIHLAPGDPALILAGEAGSATPEFLAQVRHDFRLDRPFGEQLLAYVGAVARGDLGYSYHDRRPVSALILERLPPTLLLMAAGFLWAVVGGVGLGVLAAQGAGTWVGTLIVVGSLLAYATPVFWFGLMLVVVFAVWLRWLPTYGMATIAGGATGLAYAADVVWHLLLPAATLGFFYLALYTRITRASVMDALSQDFVVVARAKGLSERSILWRHVLRNAVLGVTTMAGMQIAQMVGGSVLVETIFAWPGMGRLLFDAVTARDYPVLLGVLLVSSLVVVVVNILTDVVYCVLDPRIVHGARGAA